MCEESMGEEEGEREGRRENERGRKGQGGIKDTYREKKERERKHRTTGRNNEN